MTPVPAMRGTVTENHADFSFETSEQCPRITPGHDGVASWNSAEQEVVVRRPADKVSQLDQPRQLADEVGG